MVEFEYLLHGIRGLANAHRAGTMAGHLGAAVAAGYFYSENLASLPDAVYRGVEAELDRVMQGEEAIWFNVRKVGLQPADLFQPLPEQPAAESGVRSIAAALSRHAGTLRQSGHDVIFASIGLRALHDHTEYATPAHITGIRQLIEAFGNTHPGRGYFGSQTGWRTGNQIQEAELPAMDNYADVADMVLVTVRELIASAAIHRQGFGGLWHVINHAAAIVELERLGYDELARKALPAHRHHIRLWRLLPDMESELGPVVQAVHDPREPEYWAGMLKRDQARLTHRIKTLYGFSLLTPFITDPGLLQQAEDAFRYLMD